ncbi:MAG: hypothetical protein WCC69_05435 [Pirellulales bacterium]
MKAALAVLRSFLAIASIAVVGLLPPAAHGQTKKEEAEYLAAPAADQIGAEFLAPAVRQAVANGVATLVARMTAEGNDLGLAFPPLQTVKLIEMVDVPAKRVEVEYPVWEMVEVEVVEPVMESGKPTGRFAKVKRRVPGKKIGTRMVEQLVPDKDGSETMKWPKYEPGGPAAWPLNLPGLNGMALYVLVKAGLGKHPATVKHAVALAEHATEYIGLPDATFDVAWMAAGFASLGPNSPHVKVSQRLIAKLIDGQIREKGELEGLWGPVCVNYGYYGKLFTLGQTVRQELDVTIAKKLETATGADQARLVAMGNEMQAVATAYAKTHRDVFRAGTRMLQIQLAYPFEQDAILPGLPYNAYQWVVSDVESTEAATFALAVAKQAGLLPRETERLAIRSKKIHPPTKTEAVVKSAAKRMAAAIDDEGGATALAFVADNTGFEKTGFPAPNFATPDAMPPMFGFQTACTAVAAQETLESLAAIDSAVDKQLAEPRKRARDRTKQIASRWYKESANPAADAWKGIYAPLQVSHADLTKSGKLAVPSPSDTAVESLPWGPSGCLYRIVPGFRGLFAGSEPKEHFASDLFRQIAYRLVALQDQHGQWSIAGNQLLSTASESIVIGRVANYWHAALNRNPPVKIGVPDPVSYQSMLHPHWHGGWATHYPSHVALPDAGVFPTLASLLFLLEATDRPVSLDGIDILPPPPAEPPKETDPDKPPPRLTPVDAVRRVPRPNPARQELFDAIVATRWPRKAAPPEPATPATPATDKPEQQPAAEKETTPKEDDGLGTFEDLLKPAGDTK